MGRLASGQTTALDDLMERHAEAIFRFLHRMLGNEDDANELAQEAFVRVFQHCRKFDPGLKFSTWLYAIAANLGRNHLRWRSKRNHLPLDAPIGDHDQGVGEILPGPDASPGEQAERSERAAAVRAAVDHLPDELREPVVLCEWQDLPVAEAATILRLTPKAVESRLYRARKSLRQTLQRWL